MTPIEKAEIALNTRIEQLQGSLREAKSETAREFLVQALVICIGVGEALSDYVKMIGQYAQSRHADLKQSHDALKTRHAEVLQSGTELLERFKADPTDRTLRKELERAQQSMATIQKTLKRGANALQRELAPSLAMIDPLALGVRRLAEADDFAALKRVLKLVIPLVPELYRRHPNLTARDLIDAAEWEKSASSDIDQAAEFYEAYARVGYQTLLAVEIMTMAVSAAPPTTPEETIQRANESVAARIKAITARLVGG